MSTLQATSTAQLYDPFPEFSELHVTPQSTQWWKRQKRPRMATSSNYEHYSGNVCGRCALPCTFMFLN